MAKAGIHPNYEIATITCACGAVHETASTRGSFSVEICSKCHPFYTGKQKLMDTAGRIERFQRRYQLKPGAAPEAGTAGVADRPEAPKAEAKPAAKPEAKSEAKPAGKPEAKGGEQKKTDKKPAPAKA